MTTENSSAEIIKSTSKLHSWSERIPVWFWIMVAAGLLIAGASYSMGKKQAKVSAPQSNAMARVIPDEAIAPTILSSMAREQLKDSKNPQEARNRNEKSNSTQIVQQASAPSSPVGSMAIYVSDGNNSFIGKLGVAMGTEVEAMIAQAFTSSSANVPLIAKITKDIVRDGRLLIPASSKLFGQTSDMIEDQLNLRFTRVVFPNGEDHPFSGMGRVDGKLKGKHSGRTASVLAGASLGATGVFLPGGATYGDAFLRGAHQGAVNEAGRDLSYYRKTEASPVLTVKAGKKIIVLVDRPL